MKVRLVGREIKLRTSINEVSADHDLKVRDRRTVVVVVTPPQITTTGDEQVLLHYTILCRALVTARRP
jgi:hypothetical protein